MITEIFGVSQNPGEDKRRWFTDDYWDIYVWQKSDGSISGIQVCYDKINKERVLSWFMGKGYSHNKIDDGEITGGFKRSPVVVKDGLFNKNFIGEKFFNDSKNIDNNLRDFIYDKIIYYTE